MCLCAKGLCFVFGGGLFFPPEGWGSWVRCSQSGVFLPWLHHSLTHPMKAVRAPVPLCFFSCLCTCFTLVCSRTPHGTHSLPLPPNLWCAPRIPSFPPLPPLGRVVHLKLCSSPPLLGTRCFTHDRGQAVLVCSSLCGALPHTLPHTCNCAVLVSRAFVRVSMGWSAFHTPHCLWGICVSPRLGTVITGSVANGQN